jgi:hypothetical protein
MGKRGRKGRTLQCKNDATEDWQNVVVPPQNENTTIKWESAGLAEHCSTINKYSI